MSRNLSFSDADPWSNSPNAPKESYAVYLEDKFFFAGTAVCATFYGIAFALFLQCMVALLNLTDRPGGRIKWGLAIHTTAMFSFVTVYTAVTLGLGLFLALDLTIESPQQQHGEPSRRALFAADCTLQLNQWLADGLLLYRCCVIYAGNYWVVALPCLMYLGSMAAGALLIIQNIIFYFGFPLRLVPASIRIDMTVPYFSLSLSLNILLTLLIATRLVLHSRNIRNAMGTFTGTSGLYTFVVTLLIESSALYAFSSLVYTVSTSLPISYAPHHIIRIFQPLLAEAQVIGPFLIIVRVANRSALLSHNITGNAGSIHFKSWAQSTSTDGTIPESLSSDSVNAHEETPS